jgi:uncharacterized damage-inducible protein DinB
MDHSITGTAPVTWTAPDIARVNVPVVGDERAILEGYLDWHRQTLLFKCAGLTADQLKCRSIEPSGLTLLGLVRHMAEVERWWFRRRAAGIELGELYCTEESEDGDFDDIDDADPERDFATFLAECDLARAAVAELSLEHVFHHPKRGRDMSLRWVYVHMIEEYARHNGHADILRERIDGVTGS